MGPYSILVSSLLSPVWPVSTPLGVSWICWSVLFLASHPNDEETTCNQSASCGQTAPWSHPYSSQCGQPATLVLTGYMVLFFFLVRHPSDEQTPRGQPAPYGQTAPWSHPYSSQSGQPAPMVLTAYIAVFFFLVSHPSDEQTLCSQPAPCGQREPWSHPY